MALFKTISFFFLLHFLLQLSSALVSVNPLFSDGLVLQTNDKSGYRSFIYGSASPNETIKIVGNLTGCPYTTQADSSGLWSIQVNPDKSFGPKYSINITGDTNASHIISINSITIGNVYICVGSDVMSYPMQYINNSAYELTKSNSYKTIRIATIPTINANTPQTSLITNGASIKWKQANSSTLLSFSSICYLTGQKSYDIYGNSAISIGLIQITVPQSYLDCWMSQTVLNDANSLCQDNQQQQTSKLVDISKKNKNHRNNKNSKINKINNINNNTVCSDSSLFNGMINPLISQAYRAMIISIGENEISSNGFGCKLRLMFNDMRDLYASGDFPVGVIQPSSVESNSTLNNINFGDLRAEELEILPGYNDSIYVTALISTYDLGNRSSVSSSYKVEVGTRAALKLARIGPVSYYDHNSSLYEGPVIYNAYFSENGNDTSGIILNFTNLGPAGKPSNGILQLLGTADCIECCDSDKVFGISNDNQTWHRIDTYSVYSTDPSKILIVNPIDSKDISASDNYYVRYGHSTFVECAIYRTGSTIPALAPFIVQVVTQKSIQQVNKHSKTSTKSSIVAATPPMGFNSWNFAHCNMDARLVRQTALKMIELGLRDVGYEYINLDDCWQTDRTYSSSIESQVIIPDTARYPMDMSSLSSWLSQHGFKFGIYTSRTAYTCQDRYGSYLHEEIDVITYCSWNISYIKVDKCGGADYSQQNDSWIKFRNAIDNNCSHDIVLSVEYCESVTGCGEYIANLANLWRASADVEDNWDSILSNADKTQALWTLAGPGHWNDPDMLEVGNAGLSNNEEKVQMSLWSIMASPLLIATDLMSIKNSSLQILLNKEVIDVNQDVLGIQGRKLVSNTSGTEIWFRPLDKSDVAVVLLNRDESNTFDISVDLTKIGVDNGGNVSYVSVREIWEHKDMGNITKPFVYTAKGVGPHSCSMVRVVSYYNTSLY